MGTVLCVDKTTSLGRSKSNKIATLAACNSAPIVIAMGDTLTLSSLRRLQRCTQRPNVSLTGRVTAHLRRLANYDELS